MPLPFDKTTVYNIVYDFIKSRLSNINDDLSPSDIIKPSDIVINDADDGTAENNKSGLNKKDKAQENKKLSSVFIAINVPSSAIYDNEEYEKWQQLKDDLTAALSGLPGEFRTLITITSSGTSSGAASQIGAQGVGARNKIGGHTAIRGIGSKNDKKGTSLGNAPHDKSGSYKSGNAFKTEVGGIDNVKHIIAIASGKGGVGKSTVSAHLAAAFAGKGYKVGLLDADIYGPSQPYLFNIFSKPDLCEDSKTINPHEILIDDKHPLKLMSLGFLLDMEAALVWRGPMIISAIKQMLGEVKWGELDILFIDLPPGTGDAQLTLAQNASLTGGIIVTTPQDLALIDARRAITMFQKLSVPILGLIENMSGFCCPNCHTITPIFGQGQGLKEAELKAIPALGSIPLTTLLHDNSGEMSGGLGGGLSGDLGGGLSGDKNKENISNNNEIVFTNDGENDDKNEILNHQKESLVTNLKINHPEIFNIFEDITNKIIEKIDLS